MHECNRHAKNAICGTYKQTALIRFEIEDTGTGIAADQHEAIFEPFTAAGPRIIDFKIINLDCVIGHRGIPIQLPPSSLAKLIILKPIEQIYREEENSDWTFYDFMF
jgi:hypothetical protein